jgi:hypothetical protein
MTENPTPRLPTGQTIKWLEADLITQYANIMALAMTPFDISVTFGEIGIATADEVEAAAKIRIVLSPEQAANLMKLLTIAVGKYTGRNGALRTSGALDEAVFEKSLEENLVLGGGRESR